MSPAHSVLIVDIDHSFSGFLREKLTREELKAHSVLGGDEARKTLKHNPQDLVICRLEMPHPNGGDLLAEFPDTPFIIIANELTQSITDSLESAHAVLGRPVSMNLLYENIETALHIKLDGPERRRYPRLSIHLDMDLTLGKSTSTRLRFKTRTLDISLTGFSFEREVEEFCPSYTKGRVPTDHAFFRCFELNPDHRTFHTIIQIPGDEPLQLNAVICHVIPDFRRNLEYIGCRFVDATEEQIDRLKAGLKRVIDSEGESHLS